MGGNGTAGKNRDFLIKRQGEKFGGDFQYQEEVFFFVVCHGRQQVHKLAALEEHDIRFSQAVTGAPDLYLYLPVN
jgi:hypothetical protein